MVLKTLLDDSSDDVNKDSNYNADSDSSDEENNTLLQSSAPQSNNTTQNSLETSLNVTEIDKEPKYIVISDEATTEIILDQNVNLPNESTSDMLLHENILPMNISGLSDLNVDIENDLQVTILPFPELNDIDVFLNTDLCCQNVEENVVDNGTEDVTLSGNKGSNVDKNNCDDVESDDNNNIESNIHKKSEELHKSHSCVYNSIYGDDSSDDVDKDPNYNADSDSSDEENNTLIQPSAPQSNNTTQNSLETSLNVTGSKMCDDTNLHVNTSKSKGSGKQIFCYYCKKMQSKISRHLEKVHKNEDEVKKFTTLPKVSSKSFEMLGDDGWQPIAVEIVSDTVPSDVHSDPVCPGFCMIIGISNNSRGFTPHSWYLVRGVNAYGIARYIL
ncbi:putative uncharacterized protein DDB_G0282133 [Solenopsis invicta]|uniref:putative uncharacterized protein DDB_G0282133 n=1 Tax=Solenopsis invicta TaxID=13686 RepID=UPI00193E1964|nr:putative uncharacterized protein DDB_G0282133 [Solenopsis invicta]